MNKDLTNSLVHRKNILNNSFAIEEISNIYDIKGIEYEGIFYFTNSQIANFFNVDLRTIERTIENHKEELHTNERSEEHTSELQSRFDLVCRLLLEKKN